MKPYASLLSLCALLLAACPSSGGGLAEDGSTGVEPTTGAMTTMVMTTAVDGSSGIATSDGSTSTPSSSSGDPDDTGRPACVEAKDCDNGSFCDGVEACVDGSCMPGTPPDCDDGDCAVDNHDTDCWGPCDNNESGWAGEVPGQQNQSECNVMDCYFDQNSGTGNDNCYWSHTCDPLEPGDCTHDPNYSPPGTPLTCPQLQMMQSETCLDFCGPLVPNGCDCFGCCDVSLEDGSSVTVYLGTEDPDTGVGTCNLEAAADPVLCNPCTQVAACLNPCEQCELCIGQVELPPGCEEQECPPGLLACGQPGQDPCPMGQACVTGCCVPNPQ
jgi:hypothetical protein